MIKPSRACPVCNAGSDRVRSFLDNSIDPEKLSGFSYSSRKAPEYMSHRLVQCRVCDLVYADQPPDADKLERAYHEADYDSYEEANDAAASYIRATLPVLAQLKRRERVLEIGTGTGIFLESLKANGFTELVGVEPSVAAIEAAPEYRRTWIRKGMFHEADFEPASFDLVCCFMTLEHVRDPKLIADAAMRLLRPGGAFIAVTHDYRSRTNRLLGRRSPIIDVEHLQLFSAASVRYLFEGAKFQHVTVKAFVNRYRIGYWLRLMPLPKALKSGLAQLLERSGLNQAKLGLNVGNLYVAGFKSV